MTPPTTTPLREVVDRLAPALGFLLAAAALATAAPAVPGVETAWLGAVGALALAAAGLVAPGPGPARCGAVAAAAVFWLLPAGPARGAFLVATLIVVLAAAALAAGSRPRRAAALTFLVVPLAVQALLRGGELFPGVATPLDLARFALPPLLAGIAMLDLARRRPLAAIVAAGLAAAWLAGGWTATAALALAALAAGDRLRRPRRVAVTWAALVVLALPLAWDLRSGAVALAAGLAVAGRPLAAATLAALVSGVALAAGGAGGVGIWLAIVAVPLAWAAPRPVLFAAAAAALAGALLVPGGSGLVAGAALAAVELPAERAAARLQAGWGTALALVAAALASYPWMRPDSAGASLDLLGLQPGAAAALGALAAGAILVLLAGRLPGGGRGALVPLAAVIAVVVVAALPAHTTPLLAEPVTLTVRQPRWRADLEARTVGRVVVHSLLADSGTLAEGTPVAHVDLWGEQGPLARRTLRHGRDTGEWAVRRVPGRAAAPGPAAWSTWVVPDGRGLAQRYRSAWRPSAPVDGVVRVRVVRARELPPQVAFSLLRVEVEP